MNKNNHSNALLLELLIVIVFFAFSAVILAGVFAAGRKMSNSATARDQALIQAQSIAEELYAGADSAEILTSNGFTEESENCWQYSCDSYSAEVTLWSEEQAAGTLSCAKISASYQEEELFVLPVSRYLSSEVLP